MRFKTKIPLLLAFLLVGTTGATCITVDDDNVIVVNVDDISGTYNITPGALFFANPNDCVTKTVSDYLDSDYGLVVGGRLVDVHYQAYGTWAGSIQGGSVSVNDTQMLTYDGPWSSFTTKQSMIDPNTILNVESAGVLELLRSVQTGGNVMLCVGGNFSQAAPAGLSVKVTVFAQLDIEPE